MSNADENMQQFFMQIAKLYEGGYTDMEIDYKKKAGNARKLRIVITEVPDNE